ncbi:MAG: hypothetical protein ACRENI_13040 [Gemmatimonadaceae bacterium]
MTAARASRSAVTVAGKMYRNVGRVGAALIGVAALAGASANIASAQMLGLPVLQNAFANPGFTGAVNYGESGETLAYGVAGAWAPASARIQVSGGVARFDPDSVADAVAYAARVSVPVLSLTQTKSVGLAAFAGAGGARFDDEARALSLAVGAAIGYRWAANRRALSVYASPSYRWERYTPAEGARTVAGVVRLALGFDIAITRSIGMTIGYELGKTVEQGEPGPTGGIFGAGLSYSFR